MIVAMRIKEVDTSIMKYAIPPLATSMILSLFCILICELIFSIVRIKNTKFSTSVLRYFSSCFNCFKIIIKKEKEVANGTKTPIPMDQIYMLSVLITRFNL